LTLVITGIQPEEFPVLESRSDFSWWSFEKLSAFWYKTTDSILPAVNISTQHESEKMMDGATAEIRAPDHKKRC
jgi:hypothetical protein